MLFIAALAARGQSSMKRYIGVSWAINKPLSNTSYVSDVSNQGMQLTYREVINDRFAMGGDFNLSVYKGYTPRQTYYGDSGALTSDYFKYVQTIGLTLNGDYLFSSDKKLIPFLGLGLGASYNEFKTYYNIYSTTDSSWGVLVRPQAGAIYRIGKNGMWGVSAAAYFDYSSCKSTEFDYTNFTCVGIKLALVALNVE